MDPLPYIITGVVVVLGLAILFYKMLSPWWHFERMVNDLAEGKRPRTFVFHGARRFIKLALNLERLADEHARLKGQISSEEFNLQAILSSMVEGVMVVDNAHTIRLVNASFLNLFNLRNNPVGQTALAALRDASVEEILRATSQTGETQTGEVTFLFDNQISQKRYFSVSSVPIKSAGTVNGMVTVFHDITRLRQLEDIRREFVANVSHELRTPLSIFRGYVENLIDNPAMQRKGRMEIYSVLQRHSDRLNALLEDLLTLARLEARNEKLEISEIVVTDFMEQFSKEWEAKAAQKNVALVVDVAPDTPPFPGDEFRLEQVLNNLLENALKYTSDGGKVRVFARPAEDACEIGVEDTGIGIPLADLPHIFERFYRVEKARTREKGGTGLGLSIVKHIMALHHGTVEAKSEVGKGTTITLRFPLQAK